MRSRAMLGVALAAALTSPLAATGPAWHHREPGAGEGTIFRERRRVRIGNNRRQRSSIEAYKAQRRANRLRRKALGK